MHFTATETFQLQFSASAVAEDVTSAAHSAGNFFRSKVECSDYARSHQFANQILSHAIGLDMALASGFFQFGGDGVQSVNDDGAVVAGFCLKQWRIGDIVDDDGAVALVNHLLQHRRIHRDGGHAFSEIVVGELDIEFALVVVVEDKHVGNALLRVKFGCACLFIVGTINHVDVVAHLERGEIAHLHHLVALRLCQEGGGQHHTPQKRSHTFSHHLHISFLVGLFA